jgi:hypothetical protein
MSAAIRHGRGLGLLEFDFDSSTARLTILTVHIRSHGTPHAIHYVLRLILRS